MEAKQIFGIAHFIAKTAGITAPWRIDHWYCDEFVNKLHIWITRNPVPEVSTKRSWLDKIGGISAAAQVADQPTVHAFSSSAQWQHLNCLECVCIIHTEDMLTAQERDLPWFGVRDLPFTNRLSHQVFSCFMEGMEMSAICSLLSLSFADVWKLKFAIDNGQISFDSKTNESKTNEVSVIKKPVAPTVMSSMAPAVERSIPAMTDSVWGRLIRGELIIQSKTLSFQLILTKIRLQVTLQKSEEMKLLKLRELVRYMERNERSLTRELQQIRAYADSMAETLP